MTPANIVVYRGAGVVTVCSEGTVLAGDISAPAIIDEIICAGGWLMPPASREAPSFFYGVCSLIK